MTKILATLDTATKSAAGKRLLTSFITLGVGAALTRFGVPASVSSVIGPDVVQVVADALMGIGGLGVAAFNAINHATPVVDQQNVVTPRP